MKFLLAITGLLQAVHSAVLQNVDEFTPDSYVIPTLKSNFAKNNVSAKWAPGYPKEWGSEDFHYQLSAPDPGDNFFAVVTDDEKYLVMSNGTYIQFVDLDKNTTASGFPLQVPDQQYEVDLTVRPAKQGGYDVFTGFSGYKYDDAKATIRRRLGSDLKLIGEPISYQGSIGAISEQGKLASRYGYVYDLETTSNAPVSTLNGQPKVTDLSFSPDGVHLSSVNWEAMTADLWNATSGEKIFEFPATKSQNWLTRFSPDGKYVLIALGSSNNTLQVYTLSNLTAAPIEITGFNDWPRILSWSPDSTQIAVGDDGRLRVYNFPSKEITQTWQVDAGILYSPWSISWVNGGKQIAWIWRDGKYMYDFETNTEWLWTVSLTDHSWGPFGVYITKKWGAITVDGDSTVRFWKL